MNKELSDELKKIATDLLSRPETKVPDAYFEALPDQLLKRWKEEKRTSKKNIIQLQKMIATAAVVSGICISVALFTNKSEMSVANTEITSTEAYDYIINHMDEFESLLEEPLGLAELDEYQLPEPDAIEDFLLQELDGSDIEQFF
jgi:hypothetical protein